MVRSGQGTLFLLSSGPIKEGAEAVGHEWFRFFPIGKIVFRAAAPKSFSEVPGGIFTGGLIGVNGSINVREVSIGVRRNIGIGCIDIAELENFILQRGISIDE